MVKLHHPTPFCDDVIRMTIRDAYLNFHRLFSLLTQLDVIPHDWLSGTHPKVAYVQWLLVWDRVIIDSHNLDVALIFKD